MANPTVGVIYNEPKRISDLIKREQWVQDGWCREEVTFNYATATDLTIGSVLGKVTADGKYAPRDHAAVDGTAVSAAVVLENVSAAAGTDTKVLVAVRGDIIYAKESLVFDVAHDAGQIQTAVDELAALNMLPRKQLV